VACTCRTFNLQKTILSRAMMCNLILKSTPLPLLLLPSIVFGNNWVYPRESGCRFLWNNPIFLQAEPVECTCKEAIFLDTTTQNSITRKKELLQRRFKLNFCIHLHKYTMRHSPATGRTSLFISCILSQIHYKGNKNAVAIWIKILLELPCVVKEKQQQQQHYLMMWKKCLYPHDCDFALSLSCMHAGTHNTQQFIEADANGAGVCRSTISRTDLRFSGNTQNDISYNTNGSLHIISLLWLSLAFNATGATQQIWCRPERAAATPASAAVNATMRNEIKDT
jgi:hypothetical protein